MILLQLNYDGKESNISIFSESKLEKFKLETLGLWIVD